MTEQDIRQALHDLSEAMLGLCGALIDLQPPDTQDKIAEVQLQLLDVRNKFLS